MTCRFVCLLLATFLGSNIMAFCQGLSDDLRDRPWPAQWIAVKGAPAHDYGVYHFRKTFELPAQPQSFWVHVSADNRYKLYVNGQLVSLGPARGDFHHWRFETVDLAPFLKQGKNVLAAVVWNFGKHSPVAQISYRTGFILQGDQAEARIVDTNASWKGIRNAAYSPLTPDFQGFLAAGHGERIEAGLYPWGWEQLDFEDHAWGEVSPIAPGLLDGLFQPWYEVWELTPRKIPPMELTPQRLVQVRQAVGIKLPKGFPAQTVNCTIPANTKATILLDQGAITTAYTVLKLSKGEGTLVTLRQAEALFLPDPQTGMPTQRKGHRGEVQHKVFVGYADQILVDGGDDRTFTSLWWRTYRYLLLTIETQKQPLIINDLYGIYTGYPFERKAIFQTEQPQLTEILDVGWRTARLCANETYMDCPYYEQLQYVGDTRIQALVSIYNTGDSRLMRNAIEQFADSHGLSGLTQSRYPNRIPQYIPTFSLWWVGMLADHWRYCGDSAFVSQFLPASRAIFHFFESHRAANKLLKNPPYWHFTDWAENERWDAGVPPKGPSGQSSILDLQVVMAYQSAIYLEEHLGFQDYVNDYRQKAEEMSAAIRKVYWNEERQLFADTPEHDEFSQHANALAVLAGVSSGADARRLMERVLHDRSLTQATIYFKYYLHQAAIQAGLGDRYLDWLGEWRNQLALGLSTWAEQPEPSRSDCHAWGASPNIEFFRTVLGIDAAAPGFAQVRIAPHLGELRKVKGRVPHPKGDIEVALKINGKDQLEAEVFLPEGVTGGFFWKGKEKPLRSGSQILQFE